MIMSSISDISIYDRFMNAELSFGEWLEDQYLSRGLTQREFADMAGVGQSTVSAWVNNVQPPTRRNCNAIAGALGLPAADVWIRAGIIKTEPRRSNRATADPATINLSDPLISFSAMNQDRLTKRQKRLLIQLASEWLSDNDESGREV